MSNILKRRGKEKRKKLEAGLAGDMLPPGTMLVSFKKYMLDEPDSIDRVLDYLNIRSAILSGLVDKDHELMLMRDRKCMTSTIISLKIMTIRQSWREWRGGMVKSRL